MQDTKTDVILKNFWQNNERFADLFNVVLFEGEEIIKPEALEEMDTDVSGVIRSKDYEETLSRTRDVIKKTAYGIAFVILGIIFIQDEKGRPASSGDYLNNILRRRTLGWSILSERHAHRNAGKGYESYFRLQDESFGGT